MCELYADILLARPINTEWTDTWALFDAGGTKFALHASRLGNHATASIPRARGGLASAKGLLKHPPAGSARI
jgi:hypothetical protein